MRKIIYSVFAIVSILIISIIVIVRLRIDNKIAIGNVKDMNYEFDEIEQYYNEIIKLSEHIKKDATREEKEIIYNYSKYPRKAITEMCKKNGNWDLLPIDNDIYSQYNEKDGILKGIIYDNVDGIDEEDIGMARVIISNGQEKTKYTIDYSYGPLISNIIIFETMQLVDKDGKEQDVRYKFIGEQSIANFNSLCFDGILWDDGKVVGSDIAITESFRKKYPLFLDLFTHYSPLDYNPITFDKSKSKLNNHIAYFIVTSVLECKEREYEVYYQLDENNYLDDAYAVCVKEKELEATNTNSGAKAFYLNSNLENTNLSYEFKQYIKEHGSYNSDIKDIYINKFADEVCLDEGVYTKFIRCYKMNNDDINSYYVEYSYDDKIIKSIISIKLPYKNMSIEKVKEQYLKDLESKK